MPAISWKAASRAEAEAANFETPSLVRVEGHYTVRWSTKKWHLGGDGVNEYINAVDTWRQTYAEQADANKASLATDLLFTAGIEVAANSYKVLGVLDDLRASGVTSTRTNSVGATDVLGDTSGFQQRFGKLPLVRQAPGSAVCVPACGVMVLERYGYQATIDELAFLANTNVGKRGTYMNDMSKVLNKSGLLTARPVNYAGYESISNQLRTATDQGHPVIAEIRVPKIKPEDTGLHAIVVDGVTTRMGKPVVAVRDPAGGKYFMPAETFDNVATGQVIVTKPLPKPGGKR